MHNPKMKKLLVLLGLIALVIPALVATAAEDEDKAVNRFILGDEFENIAINADGAELTITVTENGKSKVAVVDMEQIGYMLNDTMDEVSKALADLQLDFRLGQDNSFKLELDDEEWEIDFNSLMSEVGVALEDVFSDLDGEHWAHHKHDNHAQHYSRDDRHEKEQENLDNELEDLRQELENLKKELARLEKLKSK